MKTFYTIKLTEEQLYLIHRAVDIMLRSGMGQPRDLAKWLASKADRVEMSARSTYERTLFDAYLVRLDVINSVLGGVMEGCGALCFPDDASDTIRELETLYESISEALWPMQNLTVTKGGKEPIPEIHKLQE